jgi:hypothetical protein
MASWALPQATTGHPDWPELGAACLLTPRASGGSVADEIDENESTMGSAEIKSTTRTGQLAARLREAGGGACESGLAGNSRHQDVDQDGQIRTGRKFEHRWPDWRETHTGQVREGRITDWGVK